jgi:hypothetical protein
MFPAAFCSDLLMRSHNPPYQRKVSVMIWGCITWYGVGTLCKVDGNINALVRFSPSLCRQTLSFPR